MPGRLDPLTRAALWAVCAALAGRECGLAAATLVAALGLALTLFRGRAGPWIWAFPAAFAGAAPPPVAVWPRPGPVWVVGTVRPGVRVDPVLRSCSFEVEHAGQRFRCIVADPPRGFAVLPGDRIEGPGHVPLDPDRPRLGLPPRITTSGDALRISAGRPGLARLADSCRLAMQHTILRWVPGPSGALLCHLVLGGGPAVAAELTQAHRATGVSHLLAVSGAHLTMLAWLLGFTFTLATRRSALGNRWFHTVCSAVLVLYGAITGMDPPVFRALVATSVFLLGTSAGRRVPVSGLLALPALLTALFAPRDLLGVSFNLSYAAVVGLFLSGGLRGGGWRERYWIGPLQCSVWAALCTMPLTLWYFGQWAPWTIVATPLLGPLVAAMLGLGLTTTLAAPVWAGFGWILAWPLSAMTALYCGAVQLLSRLPLAPVLAESRPSLPLLMCAGLLGTACLLWLRDRRGVVALCLSLSLPHFLPAPQPVEPGLVLVAVGHGHAGLLRLPDGTTVLVDCGSLRQPHRAAQAIARVVLPHYHIDWLVVTHGDHDHINAIPQLLARVRPRQALLPLELRGSTIESLLQRNGCTIRWLAAGARCRPCAGVLVHRPATRGNRNDQSAWVHAELGSFRAILTGDALVAGVAAWLASDLSTPADVLVLPHHGRPHDGIAPLLQRVRPRLALVSCAGRDGFTAQGKLARAAGCSVLHTGSSGTITVRASAPPTIHTERPWPVE